MVESFFTNNIQTTASTFSAFNPSQVNTHPEQWQSFMLRRPGSSALLKGTSVVVLRWGERWLSTPPTDNPCWTWDSNSQPLGYESDFPSTMFIQLHILNHVNHSHISRMLWSHFISASDEKPLSGWVQVHGCFLHNLLSSLSIVPKTHAWAWLMTLFKWSTAQLHRA